MRRLSAKKRSGAQPIVALEETIGEDRYTREPTSKTVRHVNDNAVGFMQFVSRPRGHTKCRKEGGPRRNRR